MAFTDDTCFAFQYTPEGRFWRSPRCHGGGRIVARHVEDSEPMWVMTLPAPAQVEAMFVTDDFLFVAGPADRAERDGPGFMKVISLDGQVKQTKTLPVAPVHDGIAAARGKVFAVLRNGEVVCYESR